MGENKEYMTHPEELGFIHISEEVLASLAAGGRLEIYAFWVGPGSSP